MRGRRASDGDQADRQACRLATTSTFPKASISLRRGDHAASARAGQGDDAEKLCRVSVAKLIGETVETRDGVGGSGDSLIGGARGQGGLADWAQVRARVPLSRRSDAHAAAVTRSHARTQAQPSDTETDAFIHPQAATLPLDESGADK